MNNAEEIYAFLRKNRGKPIIFASAATKSKDLEFRAAKKGNPKKLATELAKEINGSIAAYGAVTLQDDDDCIFDCDVRKGTFKESLLKKAFKKVTPVIHTDAAAEREATDADFPEFDDAAADNEATDAEFPDYADARDEQRPAEAGEAPADAMPEYGDARPDNPPAEAGEAAAEAMPEYDDARDMVTLWEKDLATSIKVKLKDLERSEKGDSYDPKTTPPILERVDIPKSVADLRIPASFLRTLKKHGAVVAAQRWIDELNEAHDAFVADVVGPIFDQQRDAPTIVRDRAKKLDKELLAISEKHSAAVIKRYQIAEWYIAKRNLRVGTVAIGFTAAVAGAATSAGNPLALVPAVIASARALASAIDLYRVHFRDLEKAATAVNTRVATLDESYQNARTKALAKDVGKSAIDSVIGAQVLDTLPGVSSDLDALEARLAKAEISLEKAFKDAEKLMKKVEAAAEGSAKETKLGKAVTKALDAIGEGSKTLAPVRRQLNQARTILDKLTSALGKKAIALDVFDKVFAAFINVSAFTVNLGAGLGTASDAAGYAITAIGAAADAAEAEEGALL